MLNARVFLFSILCRRTGGRFRRAVLISVVLLGIWLILSEVNSNYILQFGQQKSSVTLNHGRSRSPLYKETKIHHSQTVIGRSTVEVLSSTLSSSPFTSLSQILPPASSSLSKPAADSPGKTATHSRGGSNRTSSHIPSATADSRILVLYDQPSISTAKYIRVLLQAHRIPYTIHLHRPDYKLLLEERGRGMYCVIICADMVSLYRYWERSHLLHYVDYANRYNATLINFINSSRLFGINGTEEEGTRSAVIGNFSLTNVESKDILGVLLESSKEFYYLKTDEMITAVPPHSTWTSMAIADLAFSQSEVLAEIKYKTDLGHMTSPVVLVTGGGREGFIRVLIGTPMSFWLTKLMLLEVIRSYVPGSRTLARFGRKRWLMVDIDDMFLAPRGLKLTPEDVQDLINTQNELRQYVPGLTFNLGFCGYYYDKGMESEINGSLSLTRNRDLFWWFGHMYNHNQPHTIANETELRASITRNTKFATNHSIPVKKNGYAVSPHHSGVYPLHAPLYRAWVELLNVSMTTTEEYPHLYPPYRRRGFMHQGIMVLPRQTCHLYTHTYLFSNFEGGQVRLKALADGGDVFDTILFSPVSIFMTHVSNYARDRLASFLFIALFKFITRWTKLEMYGDTPLPLGRKYFSIFPEDKYPLWTSPCTDKRHMEIWAPHKNCSRLPTALVLGPQKSGTTALQLFLKTHPNISVNHQTHEHFEEVQFFSSHALYHKGIDWYMEQFPYPNRNITQVLFEKSATYFTHPLAPARVQSLLPNAKLMVILHDPIRRAYSWYQHMLFHNDRVARNFTFMEMLLANQSSPLPLQQLQTHCLDPGRYFTHIARWLLHFSESQIHFVDGVQLRLNPVVEMNRLQKFLEVDFINYTSLISFSAKKRYFCSTSSKKELCLGKSKGRKYRPLQACERDWLQNYYHSDNLQLINLLARLRHPPPRWLVNSRS